jgi:drug/metabolite transporter (DMT)-like permease
VFKYLDLFKVDTLQALIVNYFTAFFLGLLFTNLKLNELSAVVEAPWIWASLLLGVLFIFVFSLMVKTTQTHGVGVVSVASKMSLSIPVLFVFMFYGEPFTILKIVGFILALSAVFLISYTRKSKVSKASLSSHKLVFLLPLWVFLGSGVIETSLKYIEEEMLSTAEVGLFSAVVFLVAGCSGLLISWIGSFKRHTKKKPKDLLKNIVSGICLGVPNFFSVYFFILALKSKLLSSAGVFIINNVSIVVIATILGIILFKEKFEFKNKLGVGLAILSICLIFIEEF